MGRDRPGLLYGLAKALTDAGVSIKSAKISTYGEQAVDVFYVRDKPGYKIEEPRRLEALRRKVMTALALPSDTA